MAATLCTQERLMPETTTAVTGSPIEAIENKVRAHLSANRVRMRDTFHDFDKLRKGYVTAGQFRRCLGRCTEDSHNVPYVTEDEYQLLAKHYDTRGDGTVNYVNFIDSVDQVYELKDLEKKPRQMVPVPREVLKNTREPLSPRATEILEIVRQYVRHHGSDVKSWYRDFDKHNSGYVTYNQFRRGFPPNLLGPEDIDLIMSLYSDEPTQTVNYYKMNTHVNRARGHPHVLDHVRLVAKQKQDEEDEHYPVGTENLLGSMSLREERGLPSVDMIEHKIRRDAYKRRMHLLDFFRDYDNHGDGLITEHQFRAGIKQANLPVTQNEITTLAQAYSGPGARVYYRRFCSSIDTVFTFNGLEQNPLMDVHPPSAAFLYHPSNILSAEEENRYHKIIDYLRHEVETRRIMLLPFFKDCFTGYVTFSHFCRVLSMLNLKLPEMDLHVLYKKYLDHQRGLLNYKTFLKDVDAAEYEKHQVTTTSPAEAKGTHQAAAPSADQYFKSGADPDLTIQNIRYLVVSRRARVSEFFRDFDRLRRGSIKRDEFIRGLNQMSLGLQSVKYEALADRYRDPERPDCCKWKMFEEEIDRAFGPVHLENSPRKPAVTSVVVDVAKSVPAALMSPQEAAELDEVIKALQDHGRLRQCRVKDCFQEFDRLQTVHQRVTPKQLKQCLVKMKVQLTDHQVDLILKKWSDSTGNFHYLLFAEAVEPTRPEVTKTTAFARQRVEPAEPAAPVNVTKVLDRLKTKVRTERMRVIDVMRDFDTLRHGRIKKDEFRRSCKTHGFQLTERELSALEEHIAVKGHPGYVDYVAFSDELESTFTVKGLESDPLREPAPFKPYYGYEDSVPILTFEQRNKLEKVMRRFGEIVRQRRMYLLTYFEDFDRIHDGTVTPSQFRSVLGNAGLALADDEFELLRMNFARSIHVDYIRFWQIIVDYAKKQWTERPDS